MTHLKRFAFHLLMLSMGGGLALLILGKASQQMKIPIYLTYILLALFMALAFAVSQLIVSKIFPFTKPESVIPKVKKQTWAWLRPRGEGDKSGFPLNKDHIIIGREVQCAIMLNDNSVSRQHSSITRLAEGYLLKDKESSNGTFVNGHRIQESLLNDGDAISIGDCEFWFEAPSSDELSGRLPSDVQRQSGSLANPYESGFSSLEQSGGFSLDPSQHNDENWDDDEDEEEGTEAWHPRPDDIK